MGKANLKRIQGAIFCIERRLKCDREDNRRYAKALASEGYVGGYREALQDVLLVLDGIHPCHRPEYWGEKV